MSSDDANLIDQLALQTRLLRAIQADMGEIRLQYTQTKSCESFQYSNLTNAIQALTQSTSVLSELICEYRALNTNQLKKYFAVSSGRNPGIYTSYVSAMEKIRDDPNRVIGCFDSYPEAQRFLVQQKLKQETENRPLEDFEESKISQQLNITHI
jgi:hypothetical protein